MNHTNSIQLLTFFLLFYGFFISIIFLLGLISVISFSFIYPPETYLEFGAILIILTYLTKLFIDNKYYKGSYDWIDFRKSDLFDPIFEYFSMNSVIDDNYYQKPKDIKKCIFALHPHGVISFHMFYMLKEGGDFTNLFQKVKTYGLVSSLIFYIPIIREIAIWLGCVESTKNIITKGYSPIIIPGGIKESIITDPTKEQIVIEQSKEFIELSIINGLPIIPVYAFGLNKTYSTSNIFSKVRTWLAHNFMICIPLFWGKYGSFIPYQEKITLVFGKPIYFPQKDRPSEYLIEDCHSMYKEELIELYEKYKEQYGDKNSKLYIL
jgi:hypothetical protein